MIKKLLSIILAIIMILALTGCKEQHQHSARFILVSVEEGARRVGLTYYQESIFYDKETGVMYLGVRSANQFGMTVLLNADGTPMLYEGER